MAPWRFTLFFCLALILVACSGSNLGGTHTNSPSLGPPVNGFGIEENHVHSMVILPDADHTIVLATHYGIFRSLDHGVTWQQTAAGPNQLMQGLMTYSLSYNPLDPQRLYVLTQPATIPHQGTLGLYTSGNGGKTWQLSIPTAHITSGFIYLAQAGNRSPSEVFVYLSQQGARGLLVSMDNGHHFSPVGGPLPFSDVLGLLPVPGEPGHLLVYGSDGIANTTDDGMHWQVVKTIQDSILEMTTPGLNKPIYAGGDAGIYVSHDDGHHFALVSTQHTYGSLTASSQQPNIIYGYLALGIYRSEDGGQTWSQLPVIKGNFAVLVIDPNNMYQVYLALSYPTKVYHFQITNNTWKSITPLVVSV